MANFMLGTSKFRDCTLCQRHYQHFPDIAKGSLKVTPLAIAIKLEGKTFHTQEWSPFKYLQTLTPGRGVEGRPSLQLPYRLRSCLCRFPGTSWNSPFALVSFSLLCIDSYIPHNPSVLDFPPQKRIMLWILGYPASWFFIICVKSS